jgi:hypothetical protein
MTAAKQYSLEQMSNAIAGDNGLAIKFMFRTHEGEELEFECPTSAIPEIVARLTGALEQAAKNVDPSYSGLTHAIGTRKYVVGVSREEKPALLLHLYPSDHCPIGFHLLPKLAIGLAEDLQKTIPILRSGKNKSR